MGFVTIADNDIRIKYYKRIGEDTKSAQKTMSLKSPSLSH